MDSWSSARHRCLTIIKNQCLVCPRELVRDNFNNRTYIIHERISTDTNGRRIVWNQAYLHEHLYRRCLKFRDTTSHCRKNHDKHRIASQPTPFHREHSPPCYAQAKSLLVRLCSQIPHRTILIIINIHGNIIATTLFKPWFPCPCAHCIKVIYTMQDDSCLRLRFPLIGSTEHAVSALIKI